MLANFATMDAAMLLSLVNMQLRNKFSSVDDLAHFYDIDGDALIARLANEGFHYHAGINQFRQTA